jgi:ribosomal protein L7/L12
MKVQFDTLNPDDVTHARQLLIGLGPSSVHTEMSLDSLTDLMMFANGGKKIQCIKILRSVYGLGLKEAKEWCESNLVFR